MPSLKRGILILTNSRNSHKMRLAFAPYLLKFKEPGGTSRGVMTEKPTFLIKIYDEKTPEHFGVGEASVFPGLSPEADGNYVLKLIELMANVALGKETDLSRHSSIQFGLEQAILDFSNGCRGLYYPGEFTQGKKEIEINGLIWMGDFDRMLQRVNEKINLGFHCLKLKIGAIDWKKEIELIKNIRGSFDKKTLMIRVDANGAFGAEECLDKLYELAGLDVDSIEQPVKTGQPELMAKLCRETPLPIALDEELIGKYSMEEKFLLLDKIKPQYIILKPSLCGGFSGASEWISGACERNIGWWVTSALESNIGLNAIAQWTSFMNPKGPQGLGTGEVFINNFVSPVYLEEDRLKFNPEIKPDYSQFDNLKWNS